MRKILNVMFITIAIFCYGQNDTLKNTIIIKLVSAKLGENLIINKIKTSPVNFDISPDGLISLKKAGVSDSILSYMVSMQSKMENSRKENLLNNSIDGENTFQKSGIYFGDKESIKFTKLDPTSFSSTIKGIYFPRLISTLIGNSANYNLTQNTPIYFNFIPSKKDLNSTNNSGSLNQEDYFDAIMNQMAGANVVISPNEFQLIKLTVKNKKRSFYRYANMMHQIKNTPSKFIIDFKYEKVSEYTFKIILPEKIIPGQYCFIYGASGQKVYDFEIKM
jgi:hypothetical protein